MIPVPIYEYRQLPCDPEGAWLVELDRLADEGWSVQGSQPGFFLLARVRGVRMMAPEGPGIVPAGLVGVRGGRG